MLEAATQGHKGKPLSQHHFYIALPAVAEHCGFKEFLDFQNAFLGFIRNIKSEIEVLPFNRVKARENAEFKLKKLEEILSPGNYPKLLGDVFDDHLGWVYTEVLDDISDRIQRDGRPESSVVYLQDAFEAAAKVRDAVNESDASLRAKSLVRHHVQHLQDIVELYEKYGEDDFWPHYKQLFATFSEILASNSKLREDAESVGLLGRMLGKIHSSSSLGANAVTIASPIFKALQ